MKSILVPVALAIGVTAAAAQFFNPPMFYPIKITGGNCMVSAGNAAPAAFRGFTRYIITQAGANTITCGNGRSVQYCLIAGAGNFDTAGTPIFGGGGGGGMIVAQAGTLAAGANSVTVGSNGAFTAAPGNGGIATSAISATAPGGFGGSVSNGGSAGNGGSGGPGDGSTAGGGGGGGGAIGTSGTAGFANTGGNGGNGSWCIADDTQYSGGSGGIASGPGSNGAGAQTPKAVFWEAPPIGTPTVFANSNISFTSGTSFTTTTTASITTGNLAVIALAFSATTAIPVSTVSDGTNSYTRAARATSGNFTVDIWYKLAAASVASGATITLTTASSATANVAVKGVQASGITAFDVPGTNAACSGGGSITTAALAQMNELTIATGGSTSNTGSGSYSPSARYSSLAASGPFGAPASVVDTLSNINATTPPGQVYTLGTGILSGTTSCAVAMFKGN
jgi:hypothetical protein